MAGSLGGPDAPQPEGGLAAALQMLEMIFLSKYASAAAGIASVPGAAALDAGADADPYKLFFPQGVLDPGKSTRPRLPPCLPAATQAQQLKR